MKHMKACDRIILKYERKGLDKTEIIAIIRRNYMYSKIFIGIYISIVLFLILTKRIGYLDISIIVLNFIWIVVGFRLFYLFKQCLKKLEGYTK